MPWAGNIFAFTPDTIARLAPAAAGVYVLWKRDRWVYVGTAANIRQQLQLLVSGENECVRNESPTDFGFEVITAAEQRDSRHQRLTQELEPACC